MKHFLWDKDGFRSHSLNNDLIFILIVIGILFSFLAIYFYRQAVQLVPDIEFRIKDFAIQNLSSGMC